MADRNRDDADLLLSLSEVLNADLDLQRILQVATDAATTLSGAQFGGFFYNGRDEQGHLYTSHVVSGVDAGAFADLPQPRITALFEPTFSGRGTVRVDDLTADPRLSGMPPRHLTVRSYLATPVVSRTGEVIGALLFGHAAPSVFDQRSERVVRSVAAQTAVAIENARLLRGRAGRAATGGADDGPAGPAAGGHRTPGPHPHHRGGRRRRHGDARVPARRAPGRRLPAHARGRPAGRGGSPGRAGAAPQYRDLRPGSRDPVSVTDATGEPVVARTLRGGHRRPDPAPGRDGAGAGVTGLPAAADRRDRPRGPGARVGPAPRARRRRGGDAGRGCGSARPGPRPGQAVRGGTHRPCRPQPQRRRADRRVRHLAAVPAASRAAADRAGDGGRPLSRQRRPRPGRR